MTKDAIIVLAGGVTDDGHLPEKAKLRVLRGIALFKKRVAPRIIMSGKSGMWLPKPPPKTEAEAMKEYAVQEGVPPSAIIKEETSQDTIGNAYFTKVNFLEPKNWKDIIVVTSNYHLKRTKFIFDTILGSEYSIIYDGSQSELDDDPEALTKEDLALRFITEWFDSIKPTTDANIKKLIFSAHPAYAERPTISKEELLKKLGRKR